MELITIEYRTTQIAIVVEMIVARTKCAITCSLFNIHKVRYVLNQLDPLPFEIIYTNHYTILKQ